MNTLLKIFKALLPAIISLFVFSSCVRDEEPDPGSSRPDAPHRLILIYAVAANNLSYNFISDMSEIKEVAGKLDLDNNLVLVYSVNPSNECKLQKIAKNSQGKWDLVNVRTFSDLPLSVNPERIADVMAYVDENFGYYPEKGLILWSHATGWLPWFGEYPSEKRRSFGSDHYDGVAYQCNITDLAEVIPDDMFDYIWFDCCYMANIETVFQLREKTGYIAGYVTEIWDDGMPYHLTMPHLLTSAKPLQERLHDAAYEIYRYYDPRAVTVSVMKTGELPVLAEACASIFATGNPPESLAGIQYYSRAINMPFYDLWQLLSRFSDTDETQRAALREALSRVVVCKYASERDFSGGRINFAEYSGLSVHNFINNGSQANDFYTTLDWFRATR